MGNLSYYTAITEELINNEDIESTKFLEMPSQKPSEIDDCSDTKYIPYSYEYIFKYHNKQPKDREALIKSINSQFREDLLMNNTQNSVKRINSNLAQKKNSKIKTKKVSKKGRIDIKYLEYIMSHPTWFTIHIMEVPEDFDLWLGKPSMLKNIETIQHFFRKTLADAMCLTSKDNHQLELKMEPDPLPYFSIPQPLKSRMQQNTYFGINKSNYNTEITKNNKKEVKPKFLYEPYGTYSNNNFLLNTYQFHQPFTRSLLYPNQWPTQWKNKNTFYYKENSQHHGNEDNSLFKESNIVKKDELSKDQENNFQEGSFPENIFKNAIFPIITNNEDNIYSNIKYFSNDAKTHTNLTSQVLISTPSYQSENIFYSHKNIIFTTSIHENYFKDKKIGMEPCNTFEANVSNTNIHDVLFTTTEK